jgi:hypothetical protein
LSLTLNVPPGANRIRIDPPPFLALTISNLSLLRTASSSEEQGIIDKLPLNVNRIFLNGDDLQTSSRSNDPYLYWDLPESLISDKKTSWIFTASVRLAPPSILVDLLKPDIAELVKGNLLAKGDRAALQRFVLRLEQVASSDETVAAP